MPSTLRAKIEAEHRLRELLESAGLPAPTAVEYGSSCVRLFFHETQTCVVIDLDEDTGDGDGSPGGRDQ